MLGKSKPAITTSTAETQTAKIGTIIGPGAIFKGDITAPEAIRIDGTLTGNCVCKGNLILGTEGQIKGNIKAQNVILSGKVVGDVDSSGRLELLSTGKLSGNITARSLVIDEDAFFDTPDAFFDGRCAMVTNHAAALEIEEEEPEEDVQEDGKASVDKY